MKIGIYVGSFNPVHIGHIKIANTLLDMNILDKILLIPTGVYWNKNDLVDLNHRINMLKFFETDRLIIDNNHNNYPYTYQILNKISQEFQDDEIYLIIGADLLCNFHLWKNVDELLKYKILVINRDDIDIENYIKKFRNNNNFIIVNHIEKMNISSTEIRKNIKKSKDYLDSRVFKYIEENKLY